MCMSMITLPFPILFTCFRLRWSRDRVHGGVRMSVWSEKVLLLLRRMNSFHLAGSSRDRCFRFEVGGVQVGWVSPHVASMLANYPDVFRPPQGGVLSLCPSLDAPRNRSEALDLVLQDLRKHSELNCLRGWRDENYSVMPRFSDVPLMWMERAATSLFGVKRYGVHVNGYIVEGGVVSVWLARRSVTKQTFPGLLDNMAAGGVATGVGIKHTLMKECWEEASIPACIAERAQAVSTVSYTYHQEDGVFPESQFVFDLQLPLDFKPSPGDGEVEEFKLLPVDQVKELLVTEHFKPNSAMVLLDFLIRHSFVDPDTEPSYQEFVAGLHQTL